MRCGREKTTPGNGAWAPGAEWFPLQPEGAGEPLQGGGGGRVEAGKPAVSRMEGRGRERGGLRAGGSPLRGSRRCRQGLFPPCIWPQAP